MKKTISNQYTGYRAPDFRFPFHVRSISHRRLLLPLEMKRHPCIRRLLKGESPLSVFKTQCIHTARQAFNDLRKKFDFAYWAITEYYIHDINDADRIIPFRMNLIQYYLIDIMQKRYFNRQPSRYVVTKTFRRCGLTTCVQAYILWLQTCRCPNNSYTCSSSDINLNPLKTDLCRFLKRDIVPSEHWLYVPKADRRAFFNTYRNPDFIRGINLGYVHFADMSKWKDCEGILTSRAFSAATSAVLLDYFTIVVIEGNIPKEDRFPVEHYQRFYLSFWDRIWQLQPLSGNPWFLDYVAYAASQPSDACLIHVNLDHAFDTSRRIHVPIIALREPFAPLRER